MRKLQIATIYVGGFISPFWGQSLAAVLPEFADSFGITLDQAAATMAFFLFPFATVMLFSSRLVRAIPPHRVVLTAYAVTLIFTFVLIFTPWWGLFVVGFFVIGVASAFITPVLQVILKALIPPEGLGSALGIYATMQSLGLLSGPLISGVASLVDWRLTYSVIAVAIIFILLVRVPNVPAPATGPESSSGPVRWIPLFVYMAGGFVVGAGIFGLGFLIALHVEDQFSLGPVGRGLVVMSGGVAALIASRRIGIAADRHGAHSVFAVSALSGTIALAVVPLAPTAWLVALAWAAAVLAAQGVQMTINLLVLRSPRGSSLLSTVQAFRFYGSGFAPLIFLPVYQLHSGWAFWLPALALGGVVLAHKATSSHR